MAKKIYAGEDDARFALGKCFIFENSIGKVVKTAKNSRGQRWDVWFMRVRNRVEGTSYHGEIPFGLDDYFSYGACRLVPATHFVREAKRVDAKILSAARKISADAGKKIDKLIAKALEEINNNQNK